MNNKTCVIGLDLGTTNSKAVALDADGKQLASASSDYRLYSPHSGWAEQKVEEVWQGVLAALKTLSGKLPQGIELAGMSISGAMHSSLAVDDRGQPLAPALTWADQRAAPQAEALRKRCDPQALYQRTGCPLVSIYHPAKLRWWIEQAPEIARKTKYFTLIKDWILFRLTGAWATDYSITSATGLLDIRKLEWDSEALDLAGVTADKLPPLVSPRKLVGGLLPEVAQACGLPPGLKVVAGAGDGGLANLGSGAAAPGQSVITVGTSGAVRRVVDQPLLDPQQRTWCYLLAEQRWFAGGAINNGGLAVQWVRERFYPELQGEDGFNRLFADAASVPAGAGGVLLVPYFSGERSPHWDAQARALLVGLGLEHGRAHIARAALEGVAFCLADVWEALQREALQTEESPVVHLTGGITRSPLWVQILADVLGVRLAPVEAADASVVGAAMLGQWALGQVGSLEELAQRVPPGPLVQPDGERHAAYVEEHRRWQGLYPMIREGSTFLSSKTAGF
jgi:gluconokinase